MTSITPSQFYIFAATDPWGLLKLGLSQDEDGDLEFPDSDEGFGYRDGAGNILVVRSEAGNLTYNETGFPSGGTISSYEIRDSQRRLLTTVSGFTPVNAATFNAAVVDNTIDRYEFLVSLLDDETTATGGAFNDSFEVGAGNDTATMGDGDDTVYKWKSGNLTFDGGGGTDTLILQAFFAASVAPATHTVIVTLGTSTGGQTQYGGVLNLTSVENIIGTEAADQITGSDDRNVIGDGVNDGGADIINAAGGDDLVKLAPSLAAGAQIDGGAGTGDELNFVLGRLSQSTTGNTVLDLTNQANNTGIFEGVTISNFESFTVSQAFITLRTFTFIGTNAAETVLGSVFVTGTTIPNGKDTLSGGGGDDILNGLSGDDTLNGDAGDDTLIYTSGVDTLDGGTNTGAGDTASLATLTVGVTLNLGLTTAQRIADGSLRLLNIEHLITGSGNDSLNGAAKSGANKLTGGLGNDTYIIGAGDTIIEANTSAGGVDTVQIAATFTLASALENLILLAGGAYTGNGNASNNVLTGNTRANILNGLGGDDTLTGGLGADRLNGGTNGAGGDTASYAGSNAAVTVDLARRAAQVSTGHASGDILIGIENVTGSSFADTLRGTSSANKLNGGTGADKLFGLGGNDTYYVSSTADVVDESVAGSGGTDTVSSTITRSLSDTAHFKGRIENLVLTGSAAISATGNALANRLDGSTNTGANKLRGLGGNDSYIVGAGDIVDESVAGSSGIDTVLSTELFNLSDTAKVKGSVENITLIGSAGGLNATGNSLANVIIGSSTANLLEGLDGNDKLNGGLGNDFLKGGKGNDTLTGGGGLDTFFFDTALNAAGNVDTITDFSRADDTIRLSKAVFSAFAALANGTPLDATTFSANSSGTAIGTKGQIVYNTATGDLIYDSNGSASGGATLFAKLTTKPALAFDDFVIIP